MSTVNNTHIDQNFVDRRTKRLFVCHAKKFIFAEIPKAGCSSLKYAILQHDFPKRLTKNIDQIHNRVGYYFSNPNVISTDDLNLEKFKDYTTFIVYRDPVKRFSSFYNEKICSDRTKSVFVEDNHAKGMSPMQVLDLVKKEFQKPIHRQEPHVRKQILSHTIPFDYVVDLGDLNMFMKEKFDVSLKVLNAKKKRYRLTEKEAERVKEIYADDYAIKVTYHPKTETFFSRILKKLLN